MKQVEKAAYRLEKYSHSDRWVSYFHQLNEVLILEPSSILEVGVGDKVFGGYIKNNTSIMYKTLDIAEDLAPDILGGVDAIPLPAETFDVVCAFEVLEHLPFEKFETALREMKRVSKKYVLISLPHFGPPIKLNIKIPLLPELKVSFKLPFPKKHVFNGQHYWEIGKKGYSAGKVRDIIKEQFIITKEFIPFENQYHHFYILEKKV